MYKEHRQLMFDLSNDLRHLDRIANEFKLEEIVSQVKEILSNIENHRFSIAVVGEFKRGKSTFINALLGKEILPADVLPTTATLNRVTYALKPAVRIFFKTQPGETERIEEISVDQLVNYVTKQAEIATSVREAVVYYPVSYCKNNVDIIDTPGLSDEETLTAITMSVLPQVDVAILVTMATAPFSESEGNFLAKLLEHDSISRMIFLVTAIDKITNSKDQKRVLQSVNKRIEARIQQYAETTYGKDTEDYHSYLKRIGHPRVFGLSGFQAMHAKQIHDPAMLEMSRFTEFETALEKFLTEEGDALGLRAGTRRIHSVGQTILNQFSMQIENLKVQHQIWEERASVIMALLGMLDEMRQDELHQIDVATERAKEKIRPYITEWETGGKSAVAEVIKTTPITWDQMQKYKPLSDRLAKIFEDKFSDSGVQLAEKIHPIILDELTQELVRLHPFTITFDRFSQHIALQLNQIANMWQGNPGLAIQSKTFGSMLSKLGGGKGYTQIENPVVELPNTSDLAPIASKIVVKELSEEFKLPTTWVMISLDSPSVNDIVAKGQRSVWERFMWVDTFKTELTKVTTAELEKQFRVDPVGAKIAVFINTMFETLKGEIANVFSQIQNGLVELQRQRERLQVVYERELHNLEKQRGEVEMICHRAHQVTTQLTESATAL